jgi:hypothetical protein
VLRSGIVSLEWVLTIVGLSAAPEDAAERSK